MVNHDKKRVLNSLKKRLKTQEEYIEKLKETIKRLETAKYNKGDIVLHKKLGAGIVQGVVAHIEVGIDMPDFPPYGKDKNDVWVIGYRIICSEGSGALIIEEDLLPYTKTTRLLYKKD